MPSTTARCRLSIPFSPPDLPGIKERATVLIDDRETACPGNGGNEFKNITRVLLNKSLNDKFAHEVKGIDPAFAKAIISMVIPFGFARILAGKFDFCATV